MKNHNYFNVDHNNPNNNIYGDYDIYQFKSVDNISMSFDGIEGTITDIRDLEFIFYSNTIFGDLFKNVDEDDNEHNDYDEEEPYYTEGDDGSIIYKPIPLSTIHLESLDQLIDILKEYVLIMKKTCNIYNKFSDNEVKISFQEMYAIDLSRNMLLTTTKAPGFDKNTDKLYNKFLDECTSIITKMKGDFNIQEGIILYTIYSTYKIDVPLQPIVLKFTK